MLLLKAREYSWVVSLCLTCIRNSYRGITSRLFVNKNGLHGTSSHYGMCRLAPTVFLTPPLLEFGMVIVYQATVKMMIRWLRDRRVSGI